MLPDVVTRAIRAVVSRLNDEPDAHVGAYYCDDCGTLTVAHRMCIGADLVDPRIRCRDCCTVCRRRHGPRRWQLP